MEPKTELSPTNNQKGPEKGRGIEPTPELSHPSPPEAETDIQRRIENLRSDIQTGKGEEISDQDGVTIETIDTPKHTIQINKTKLERIKGIYGLADWDIQIVPSFSFFQNRTRQDNKRITIHPFNIWSYVKAGTSIEKRNQRLPKLLAHEIRHAQQKPPRTLGLVMRAYWYHPTEIDARKWANEHWEEFLDVVKISKR